jgi:hypothetical protein
MRARPAAAKVPAMTIRLLAPLAAALLAAAVPAAADGAVKTGTYNGQPLSSGVDGSSIGVTVDRGKVTALIVHWSCRGSEDVDRRTIVVASAADENAFRVARDRFTWSGTAQTNVGDILSDTFQFKEAKAKVKVTGRWKGSTVTGTFSASMGGCASGPLTYAAKRA